MLKNHIFYFHLLFTYLVFGNKIVSEIIVYSSEIHIRTSAISIITAGNQVLSENKKQWIIGQEKF